MPRQWIAVLLPLLAVTGCALKDDLYPPAIPAERRVWDNRLPFMLTQDQGLATILGAPLCPASLPPTSRTAVPGMVPGESAWGTWRRAPEGKTVCTGKGKKRICKKVAPSVVEQAKAGALIKPSRQNTDSSGRTKYQFRPGADQIYQVEVGTMSPTYLQVPAGEQLAGNLQLSGDYWAARVIQQEAKQTVILGAKEAGVEAYTALQLFSGTDIWLKLVARDNAGMMSVSWEIPTPTTTPETIPVNQRPPKINRERLHTQYALEVEGKHTPPWMPVGAFDDGTRMYVYFKEPLTYTRAPGVFALDQKGAVNLTQSHMFVHEQSPDQGAYLMVQGLWPALRLQDSSGGKVILKRQNPQY